MSANPGAFIDFQPSGSLGGLSWFMCGGLLIFLRRPATASGLVNGPSGCFPSMSVNPNLSATSRGLDHLARELVHVLFRGVHQRRDGPTGVGRGIASGEVGVLGDTRLGVEGHRVDAVFPELAGHVVVHLIERSLARAVGDVGEVHGTPRAADTDDEAGLVLDHDGCDVVAHDVREPGEVVPSLSSLVTGPNTLVPIGAF